MEMVDFLQRNQDSVFEERIVLQRGKNHRHLLLNRRYSTHLRPTRLIWFLLLEASSFELHIKCPLRVLAMVFWSQSSGLEGTFLW